MRTIALWTLNAARAAAGRRPGSRAGAAARAAAFGCAALIAAGAASGEEPASAPDAKLAACLEGMLRGYPSGLEETYCRGAYDLPSPFYFKCARQIRVGFESQGMRAACAAFLSRAQSAAAVGRVAELAEDGGALDTAR